MRSKSQTVGHMNNVVTRRALESVDRSSPYLSDWITQ